MTMTTASTPATEARRRPSVFFIICLAFFVTGAGACFFVMKLNQRIERASGRVVDTYSKHVFASRKKAYDEEYLVVSYSIGGREYSGKTMRRKTGDFIPVYYYPPFPGNAWFYKRENPNMVYACAVMTLSLIGMLLSRPRIKKPQPSLKVKSPGSKK
jgi:hypothetical protein